MPATVLLLIALLPVVPVPGWWTTTARVPHAAGSAPAAESIAVLRPVTAATAGPAPRRHIAAESDLDRALWRQPVDAPIVDFFRPPSNPYGPGNRGLEYRTTPGQAVTAVADGEVVFAGQVGGRMFVVVAHSASLRSTYAFLHRVVVARGDQVSQGQLVATAGTGLHLTARVNGRYVDPLPYFGMRWSVRLVPVEHRAVGPPSRVALGPH